MRMTVATLALAAVLGGAVGLAHAGTAPIPLEVPAAWQLTVEMKAPMPIQIRLPGDTKKTTFWYVLYTVMNRYRDPATKRPTEQIFIPDFSLFTDDGKLIPAGRKTPAVVFNAIKKKHQLPLLKDMVSITGKLLFGEDNAKDGVAIWPDFGSKTGKVDIFVGGLSGEIKPIKLPTPVKITKVDSRGKSTTKDVSVLYLTKTLQLTYKIVTEAASQQFGKARLLKKKWIMR